MAAPTLTVEVAFSTTNPLTVPGSWTDVSAYVRSFSTRRGRNHELGQMGAGEATVVFDNGDRRFDPTNAAGPYFPNVLPMRRMRIRAVHNAVTYDLFQGYVEDWGQEWLNRPINAQGDAEAQVRAVDSFKLLNLTDVTTYETEVLRDAPALFYRLDGIDKQEVANLGDEDEQSLEFDPTIVAGPTTPAFGAGPLLGGSLALTNGAWTRGYLTLPGGDADVRKRFLNDWTVEAWVARLSGATGTFVVDIRSVGRIMVQVAINGTGAPAGVPKVLTNTTVSVGANAIPVGGLHHLAVVRTGTTAAVYIDGVFSETLTGIAQFDGDDIGTNPTQIRLSAGGPTSVGGLTQVAVYDHALPPDRIAAHYAAKLGIITRDQTTDVALGIVLDAIGWAAGDRSLVASTHTVGAFQQESTALDALLSLGEDTDAGLLFINTAGKVRFVSSDALQATAAAAATWGDGGGEINYADLSLRYDDADLYTEVHAAGDAGEVVAVSAAAAAIYGDRKLDADAGRLADLNQVSDRANAFLFRYDAPGIRPETLVAVGTGSDITRMAEMLNTEIGRRVVVNRRPPGGGALIAVTCLVEGVGHAAAGVTQSWQTTLNLAPVLDATPWILGNATNGVLDSTTDLGF